MSLHQKQQQAPEFGTINHNRVMWAKVNVVHTLLQHNFTVHSSDVDLAYARSSQTNSSKDVWKWYNDQIFISGVEYRTHPLDGAFQYEAPEDATWGSPINTGNFVVRPTPATKALFQAWVGLQSQLMPMGGNQKGLQELYRQGKFMVCGPRCVADCATVGGFGFGPVFASYSPSQLTISDDFCVLSGEHPLPRAIDPALPYVLYVHPVCTVVARVGGVRNVVKMRVLKEAGFWYLLGRGGAGDLNGSTSDAAAWCVDVGEMEFAHRHEQAAWTELTIKRCLPSSVAYVSPRQ